MMIALVLLAAAAPATPERHPIEVLTIGPQKPVDRVETTRVDFAPGQSMPMHKHTVPVICFATKGALLVKINDGRERPVHSGEVTLEPAGVTVNYFLNASRKAPAQLMCASLAGKDDTQLNIMLAPEAR